MDGIFQTLFPLQERFLVDALEKLQTLHYVPSSGTIGTVEKIHEWFVFKNTSN